nr:TspO/MBR family protein [Loigolactobacillus coryniformis]
MKEADVVSKIKWGRLALSIIVVELIGMLSSWLAGDIKAIYLGLNKPPLAPPSFLFGIVWPVLYLLLGIYAYHLWTSKTRTTNLRWLLFGGQITLNFLWSIVFFRFNAYWLGLLIILVMVGLLGWLIQQTKERSVILLWPYLLWLLFATYLTAGVALLN